MQDVTIRFSDGPQKGQLLEAEVGRLIIGRQPGQGGLELKGADSAVSRLHAEIIDDGGDIVLQNLSPNGTRVDGALVLDRVVLKPAARIQIGPRHAFEVSWSAIGEHFSQSPAPQVKEVSAKKGPLASPVVRAVIAVYLLGMVGLAVWFGASGDTAAVTDDWPALVEAYDSFESSGTDDRARGAMLARAEVLVRELRALRIRGMTADTESICRELMSLDADERSPLYRYGARCLGSL